MGLREVRPFAQREADCKLAKAEVMKIRRELAPLDQGLRRASSKGRLLVVVTENDLRIWTARAADPKKVGVPARIYAARRGDLVAA
jgi:hypothetical protein